MEKLVVPISLTMEDAEGKYEVRIPINCRFI